MSSKDTKAYNTHYNYIKCLSELTNGLKITCNLSLKKAPTPHIKEKENLIELTRKSLNDEAKIVSIDQDYSYASTCWLPVKVYYLLFNILLTIEYVINLNKNTFKTSHTACIKEYTRKLKNREIYFSEQILNQVFDKTILFYKTKTGSNLSSRTSKDDMYKMSMRKIAKYKAEAWRESNKINLKKPEDKLEYQKYLSTFTVCIFDFIYQMRIRSNYKDFFFIDNITSRETSNYFNSYFMFTSNLFKALMKLQNELLILRS